jgi:hypothetical protein
MSYGINDNQNVFTKDGRTTSRVLNVPGGKSSVNLGWDEQEKNEPQLPRGKKRFDDKSGKVGDRAWGHACCLPNLSLSNTFTTVNHFITTANDNPTKPPKEIQQEKDRHEMFMKAVGATSTAPKARTNLFDEGSVSLHEGGMITKHSSSNGSLSSIGKDSSSRGVSSNAYANGSHQNVGNMITDRPTSKVTQPPGGKSTIGC